MATNHTSVSKCLLAGVGVTCLTRYRKYGRYYYVGQPKQGKIIQTLKISNYIPFIM